MSLRRRSPWFVSLLAGLMLAGTSVALAGSPPPERMAPAKERKEQKVMRPRLTPVRPDALTRRLDSGKLSPAEYALERARSLFALEEVRRTFGRVAAPRPELATFILRDLSLRKSSLKGSDRREAERFFLRPDGRRGDELPGLVVDYSVPSEKVCSEDPNVRLCFHWVTSTSDKASPEEVQAAHDVFTQVWNTEVAGFGFQPPKGDASSKNAGPNGYTDIYLANLGPNYYGYCTSDDPNVDRIFDYTYNYADVSAYCVVDNDFVEFEDNTPIDNLRVTAAHEFFHAIQFSYDYLEDFWMLEGTATAIEDFVYDDINDNLQYLKASPMLNPRLPLDYSDDLSMYGTWTFWRFLTERLSATPGVADPLVIREVFERAQASNASGITIEQSRYSLQAVKQLLAVRGVDLTSLFALFGAANYQAAEFYEEGAAYDAFLGKRRVRNKKVSPASPLKKGEARVHHLANRWRVYVPGDGVAVGAGLKLKVNLPDTRLGSAASARIFRIDGTSELQSFVLAPGGAGTLTVPFGAGSVKKVLLVLTNASTRTNCYSPKARYTSSCFGKPKDDNLPYIFQARLI